MKIAITILCIFLFCECSAQKQYVSNQKAALKCQKNWPYFNLKAPLVATVITHQTAGVDCGTIATASVTIVKTYTNDTIRVLELCNTQRNFKSGDTITFEPKPKPGFDVLVGLSFYDCVLFKTCYGSIVSTLSKNCVKKFEKYLYKNVRYPAVAREKNVQGKMVVAIQVDSNQLISDVYVIKSILSDCDAEVIRKIKDFKFPLPLSSAKYTIGLDFNILDGDDKPDSKIAPFDSSRYPNFLFGVLIVMYDTTVHKVTYY